MSTIAILATVVTASLRATQPRPTKGTNQTEVPTKNTAKKSRAAATLPNSAALTPAATNGAQRLNPVRKPNLGGPSPSRGPETDFWDNGTGCRVPEFHISPKPTSGSWRASQSDQDTFLQIGL